MASITTDTAKEQQPKQETSSPSSTQEKWYQCDKCAYETRQEHILNWHKSEHIDVDPGELDCYKCGKCDFQCKCIMDFEKHFSVVHCHHCNVTKHPRDVFAWHFRDITDTDLSKIFFHFEMHHFADERDEKHTAERVAFFRDGLRTVRTRMFGHDPYFDCNLNEFMAFYVCRMMLPCDCLSKEMKSELRRSVNRAREDNVDF